MVIKLDLTLQYMTSEQPKVYNETIAPAQQKEAQANPEAVKWQLETNELIENMRMLLLNEVFVQDRETGVVSRQRSKFGKPLMNEDGIQEIIQLVKPHLDKNTILSNLTDREIGLTLKELRTKICLLLQEKYISYNAEKGDLPKIVSIIMNPIWATFKRASNETTLNYLGKTQQLHEIRRHDETAQKETFAEKLFNPFRRK